MELHPTASCDHSASKEKRIRHLTRAVDGFPLSPTLKMIQRLLSSALDHFLVGIPYDAKIYLDMQFNGFPSRNEPQFNPNSIFNHTVLNS
jgi:hypothetical protein